MSEVLRGLAPGVRRLRFASLIGASVWLASGATLSAQSSPGVVVIQRATRTDLASRVSQLEQQLASGALRGKNADQARQEVEEIQRRLTSGDFQVGDRFVITARMVDSVRADTASVRDSLKVSILNLPDMSLTGVLRSELDERLNAHVARYIRSAELRSNVLVRVGVLGAVRTPGYFYISPDRPVSDVLMLAGGPAPNAKLEQFEVYRARRKLLASKESRDAVKNGTTLEQLDVRSGDEFRIPEKRKIDWRLVLQLALVLSSLIFAYLNFMRWYYDRQE